MVLAPEHPLVDAVTTDEQRDAVRGLLARRQRTRATCERTDLAKEKTGVFTGGYAINPVNDEQIPIWIADYVLMGYGTGAIMAVPGQDERDWEFAEIFDLPIIRTVRAARPTSTARPTSATDRPSTAASSTACTSRRPRKRSSSGSMERGRGERKVKYKLRDWLFSRQRYWGEPFPIVHADDGR